MIALYPHQNEAVNHAANAIYGRGNSLIVAATGAGKTLMLAATIKKWYHGFISKHGRRPHALILVHRTEIHGQNHKKFAWICPEIMTSEITASRKSLHGNAHFGMVQTVVGQLGEFEKGNCFFDLVVFDECHHAQAKTYLDIIEWNKKGNPNAALLGVTATPNRGDEISLLTLFDNYYQITTRFLIDSHYLVRPRFMDLSPTFTVKKGKGKRMKFVEEIGHLNRNVRSDDAGRALIEKLCEKCLQHKEPGKTVIFAPSHGFCQMVYDCLVAKGRKPAYLYRGIDSDARAAELERFENGDAEELINVDIATEGYDYPQMRNIVDFDTNGTHGQWVQKVGRVLRTAQGKISCTVMDFGGNIALYPQGVEFEINTQGAFEATQGTKLTIHDFFQEEQEEKQTAIYVESDGAEHTPYNPPEGFETILDKDFGIIFVSCTPTKDCIVISKDESYVAFTGNKEDIHIAHIGTFGECVQHGTVATVENKPISTVENKPISNVQIRLLAPEYPTTAMTWSGANCAICWKTWKHEASKALRLLNARGPLVCTQK